MKGARKIFAVSLRRQTNMVSSMTAGIVEPAHLSVRSPYKNEWHIEDRHAAHKKIAFVEELLNAASEQQAFAKDMFFLLFEHLLGLNRRQVRSCQSRMRTRQQQFAGDIAVAALTCQLAAVTVLFVDRLSSAWQLAGPMPILRQSRQNGPSAFSLRHHSTQARLDRETRGAPLFD